MCGVYRKFGRNFSDVVAPLTELLKKRVKFHWTNECQAAFERAKGILKNPPVMMAPDFERRLRLYAMHLTPASVPCCVC